MLEPSTMLARLDAATRDHHGDLDGYWLDLMAQGVTQEQYSSQLVRIYGFEAPLESDDGAGGGRQLADMLVHRWMTPRCHRIRNVASRGMCDQAGRLVSSYSIS